MLSEATFARQVDAEIKILPNSFWFTVQQRTLRGHPDRIGIVNGFFVALELKRSRSAAKAKLQTYNLEKIRACRGYAEYCYPEIAGRIIADLQQIAQGDFDWTLYRNTSGPT